MYTKLAINYNYLKNYNNVKIKMVRKYVLQSARITS
jgi:hypothetical protein